MFARGDAVVEVPPITPVPDDNRTWLRVTLGADIAPPAQLQVARSEELEDRDGWKAQVLVCAVATPERTIEFRTGVFLRLLDDLGVCVAIRSKDRAAHDAALSAWIPLLAVGRVAWNADGEVVGISQLYDP